MLTAGVLRDITIEEKRVSIVPDGVKKLISAGLDVIVERGAGEGSFFNDREYEEAGARIIDSREELLSASDLVLTVQRPSINDAGKMKPGAVAVGVMMPERYKEDYIALSKHGIRAFALEKIPRISRAQGMDVLSSQSSSAGYYAAIIAAGESPRFMPMLTTAGGTVRPSRVLVIGAGVAGLMAIATARRLGASVTGYDVRKTAGSDVKSLGARFLDLDIDASSESGYARELTVEEKARQEKMLEEEIVSSDVIITTASVPGKPAPVILGKSTVGRMKPGTVIVDLAADSGGNCELTRPGYSIQIDGVKIVGHLNFPSGVPINSSEMFSRNLVEFLMLLTSEGRIMKDSSDEIIRETLLPGAEERIEEAVA